MINNDILIKALTNKDKRVKTTYNLEPKLKKEIEKEAKEAGINSSDLLNYLIYERYKNTLL